MTELTKKEIIASFQRLHCITNETSKDIQEKVDLYNEYRIEGEPEMTFDEMAELLQEKLTTYRGK
jgi:ribosomal protein S13